MDGKMNTVQRDPLAFRRDDSVRQLMNALTELKEAINGAQMIWATGKCMIDKKAASDQINAIFSLLPEAVKQASAITRDEQSIRETAQREATEQTTKSRADAQKILDDATRAAEAKVSAAQKKAEEISKANANAANAASTMKAQAEQEAATIRQNGQNAANAIYAQAQQEAEAIRRRAQQEAQLIISDAQAKANAAIANENVYIMATRAANELREETEKQMADMRHYYIDHCCNMLTSVDEYLLSLISSIRNERQDLFNQQ